MTVNKVNKHTERSTFDANVVSIISNMPRKRQFDLAHSSSRAGAANITSTQESKELILRSLWPNVRAIIHLNKNVCNINEKKKYTVYIIFE